MQKAKENTGSGNAHSINCQCIECTGGDPHMMRLKSEAGKNASFNGQLMPRFSARPGVYGTRGASSTGTKNDNFERRRMTRGRRSANHAEPVIKPIAVTAPNQTVVQPKFDTAGFLTGLASEALGKIIDMKRQGTQLPPALDKVASVGISTINSAQTQAQIKANEVVGANTLKFSPYILGGVALLVVALIYFIGKKV